MRRNLFYLLILLAFLLQGAAWWYFSTFFLGAGNAWPFIIAIASWLLVVVVALIATRVRTSLWLVVGLVVLPALFVPASLVIALFPETDAVPLQFFLIPGVALIVVALLLHAATTLAAPEAGEATGQGTRSPRMAVAALGLGIVLLAATLYNIYWFLVWDATTDSLDWFLLPLPILAAFFGGLILLIVLPGPTKALGVLYPLVSVGLLIGVAQLAINLDYRQLTEARARQVTRAIDSYYAREGQFPQNLRQLMPMHLIALRGPVIIYGQPWCYDGGEDYYRLGYVDREHWSAPSVSGHLFSAQGDAPDLPPLCEDEISDLISRRGPWLQHYLEEEDSFHLHSVR